MQHKFLILFLLFTVLYSCKKNDVPTAKPVALSVVLTYDTEQAQLGLPQKDIEVKISNLVNGQSYTATTDAKGAAVFPSIAQGNYTITVSNTITAANYQTITGINTTDDVSFGANTTATLTVDTQVPLTIKSGRIGNLVFKQVYYAGSNTSRGAVFRDQFIEIYNNSNETIYLDSLYIANGYANNKKISDGGTTFNWAAAAGMPANIGDASKDYAYARFVFMIPGNGKEHPLAPGASIVIAQTAIDHTKPYTDNSGLTQGITDPALTVDLSKADYETYFVDFLGTQTTPYRWDINNPAVPNLNVLYVTTGAKDYIMDATGREDFFIFKLNTATPQWKLYSEPVTPSGTQAVQVPVKNIIDAIEIITPLETSRIPKRLPVTLDAAGTFVTGGQYSSQSLVRKTAKVVNGRIVLQDTNNSSNDFFTKTKADPSKSAASFQN